MSAFKLEICFIFFSKFCIKARFKICSFKNIRLLKNYVKKQKGIFRTHFDQYFHVFAKENQRKPDSVNQYLPLFDRIF